MFCVLDMMLCEWDYFEKSVFVKQNVEVEMYLNVIVLIDLVNMFSIFIEIDKFEDKIVLLVNLLNLFVSLIIMLDGYDQFIKVSMK